MALFQTFKLRSWPGVITLCFHCPSCNFYDKHGIFSPVQCISIPTMSFILQNFQCLLHYCFAPPLKNKRIQCYSQGRRFVTPISPTMDRRIGKLCQHRFTYTDNCLPRLGAGLLSKPMAARPQWDTWHQCSAEIKPMFTCFHLKHAIKITTFLIATIFNNSYHAFRVVFGYFCLLKHLRFIVRHLRLQSTAKLGRGSEINSGTRSTRHFIFYMLLNCK